MVKNLSNAIDAIPWAELHHAYGPATDVPDLLRALATPEMASTALRKAARKNKRDVFDHISWELWGNVFHQGTVWQVTAATVPLLFEILRVGPDDVALKQFLLSYLHHLALGYPEDMFPELPDPDETFAPVTGKQDPGGEPDYGADDDRYLIWMRDSYEAVERQIDEILPYLNAKNEQVADEAIALCGSFPRRADQTVPILRRLASVDDKRGASACVSLAVLAGSDGRHLAERLAASKERQTAVLGACAVVIADADNIPEEVIATLTAPLDELGDVYSAHASTMSTLVGRSLMKLGQDHRERAAAGICQQLAAASPYESVSITNSLLVLVFGDEPPQSASTLSSIERKALETIRDHGAFTISGNIFGNYMSLLSGWGLPRTAKELGAWLDSE